MDKITNYLRLHIPTRRRLIQLYAALLTNAHIKGYIKGNIYTGPLKNACVPGLNCYSCPGAVGACPLGALQNALASSNKRAPYFMFGILMLLGLTFGRTICGFFCPMGLIQELLAKVNVPKLRKSRVTHVLSYLKYVILLIFVILIPLRYAAQSYPVPGFCKYICPAGTLEGAVGLLANPVNWGKLSMLKILFTRKFIIAVAIILACMFIYRGFCRFLCPLGAIYGLFSKVSLLGVRVDNDKCIECGKCLSHCKMDICHVGDHECIHCGDCISVCPTKAISYKLGHITMKSNVEEEAAGAGQNTSGAGTRKLSLRQKSAIAWIAALLVLAFVFWFVNKPDNNTSAKATAATTEQAGGSSDTDMNTDKTAADKAKADTSDSDTTAETNSSNANTTDTDAGTAGAAASEDTSKAAESESVAATDNSKVGYEVGDLCPDFTAPVYGSDVPFTLSDHLGKVVIINFWATYCTPCCGELPNFDNFYRKYSDQVDIIALHANLLTDDPEEYLAGFDYTIQFGYDETGDIITSLGGSTMLPMTVIVDQTGHITYNETNSMTYEKLEELVKPLLKQ